jgi:hypothetical protein
VLFKPGGMTMGTASTMTAKAPPGLSFTKPLKVTINGKKLQNPRWPSILLTTIAAVKIKTGGDGNKLIRELRGPGKG